MELYIVWIRGDFFGIRNVVEQKNLYLRCDLPARLPLLACVAPAVAVKPF